MLRAALLIAAKDLRQRIRDRSAIILAVIAPFALGAIFGMLLGGADAFHTRYAIADLDHGPLATAFTDQVLGSLVDAGIADVDTFDSEATATQAVRDGKASAAIVIPAGFSADVQAGRAAEMRVVGASGASVSAQIARSLVGRFADEITAVQVSLATVFELRGVPPDPAVIAEMAGRAAAVQAPIVVAETGADAREMDLRTFYAASMAILFLFFATQSGVLSLIGERRQGTLARLLAAPIPPWVVLLGKSLGGFSTGLVAMVMLIAASTLLLGARWGPPLEVGVVVVAAVVAAMGISTLVTTFARTEDQAGGWNAITAMTLAILGGSFFPLSQGPEVMASLSLVTPHAWFLRALHDLAGAQTTLLDVLPSVGVLLAMGAVTGTIGLARARGLVAGR